MMGVSGAGGHREPRFFRWILRAVSVTEDRGFILGDLRDEFLARAERSPGRARWWYRGQVLRSLLPCLAWRLRSSFRGMSRDVGQDLGFGLRRLIRTPLMVLATVLSLGLGIGAVTAVFTVGNAFLLQGDANDASLDDVVSIFTSEPQGDLYGQSSYPDFESLSAMSNSLTDFVAVRPGVMTRGAPDANERLLVEIVTDGYMELLEATPTVGRFFAPDEMVMGAASHVTVISHEYWQAQFGGRQEVLGQPLRLDDSLE